MPTAGKKPTKRGPSEVRTRKDLAPVIERGLKHLGMRLRALRQERGLTQEQAAEAIGVHPKHMIKMEQGSANLTYATLVAVAVAYKVSLRELLPEEDLKA